MEKLYYSISEVAEMLGENASLVRFWSNTFNKFLKPHRNGKGNRLYRSQDIEVLKQIHYLVKEKGMTLDGAAKALSGDRSKVDHRVRALESLKEIRTQLLEVRDIICK